MNFILLNSLVFYNPECGVDFVNIPCDLKKNVYYQLIDGIVKFNSAPSLALLKDNIAGYRNLG